MDRHKYLTEIVRFARGLGGPDSSARPATVRTARKKRSIARRRVEPDAKRTFMKPDGDLTAFRSLIMPRPRELTDRLIASTAIDRARLGPLQVASLQALESNPDLLEPMGQTRKELTHGRLIRHFLDARSCPELGRLLLNAFTDLVATKMGAHGVRTDLAGRPLHDPKITTELPVGGFGRVDLCIESPETVFFVEIKIDAKERPGQLADYQAALDEKTSTQGVTGVLVFLTLKDHSSPKSGVPSAHIHFDDVLAAWLPIAASGATPEHRYLGSYLTSVARGVCNLAGLGRFDDWNLTDQRALLRWLKSRVES